MRQHDRPRPHLIHLGQVADRGAVMLTLACRRCGRSGRIRVAQLLAEWGRFALLADVKGEARADCPRWRKWSPSPYDHCDAHWPELPALLRPFPPG